MKDKLYVLTDSNSSYLSELARYDLVGLEFTDVMADATIVLADPPLAVAHLDQFERLEWLQSTYAGVDALMAAGCRSDYVLTNVKGIFGPLISEYVVGYLTQHYRHFPFYKDRQLDKQWSPQPYQSLQGKRAVILGTGGIAQQLAQVLAMFGIEAVGVNRSGIPPKNSPFAVVYHVDELPAALSAADIVVSTLPNTPQTFHLLNQDFFAACKNVVLFNVGRGANLDEAALITAIELEQVHHAYLDVFEHEPLDSNHPFWQHPNITLTPHIAAVSFPRDVVAIFVASYQRWLIGQMPQFMVDFSKGY
jgi:phosphoglycerate dehydrogenase-like enzyme